MRFRLCISVVVVFLVISVSNAKQAGKRTNSRRRVNPALCDPNVAPYGCWPVPQTHDVMDLQTFRKKVSGSFLPIVWRIDATGFFREQIAPLYMTELAFATVGNTCTARFGYRGRLDKVSGSGCLVIVASVNSSDGTVSSKSKAIIDIEALLGPPLTSAPWRFYFTSDCPDDYVFAYSCANRNKIIDGVCYDRWLLDIIIFKLDSPPMHKIVRELWMKFGLKFDDPRNTYNRIGLPCTEDVL